MSKFTFYYVDGRYLDSLNAYDENSPKKAKRPFVGIFVKKDNGENLIPLTSKIRRSSPSYHKIIDRNGEVKGGLNILYAIPYNEKFCNPIDFDKIADKDYRNLIIRTYSIVQSQSDIICRKVHKFEHYKKTDPFYRGESVKDDFLRSINTSLEYVAQNDRLLEMFNSKMYEIDKENYQIINRVWRNEKGDVTKKKPVLKLVGDKLTINPECDYEHLEESMYQDMVENIKKRDYKNQEPVIHNKSIDKDYDL